MPKPTSSGSHTTLPGSRLLSSKAVAVLPPPNGPLIHSSMRLTIAADTQRRGRLVGCRADRGGCERARRLDRAGDRELGCETAQVGQGEQRLGAEDDRQAALELLEPGRLLDGHGLFQRLQGLID